MKIRDLASVSLLLASLLLAACGSDSSPTSNADPDPDPDDSSTNPTMKPNGTLTVDGKPFPAHVSGLYGDTSVTLIVLTDFRNADTGWSLMVETRPAKGSHPMFADGKTLNGTHVAKDPENGCVYTVKSGDASFDAWTVSKVGSYEMARMSGSASFALTRRISDSGACPDAAMSLTFENADATHIDVVGDILGD